MRPVPSTVTKRAHRCRASEGQKPDKARLESQPRDSAFRPGCSSDLDLVVASLLGSCRAHRSSPYSRALCANGNLVAPLGCGGPLPILSCSMTSAIATNSRTGRQSISSKPWVRGKVVVIENGIETSPAVPAATAAHISRFRLEPNRFLR